MKIRLLFLSILGFAAIAGSAEGATSIQQHVIGEGAARSQDAAKYFAAIDAQKKCFDLTGQSTTVRLEEFQVMIVRPDDTGLRYFEATASFGCADGRQISAKSLLNQGTCLMA